MSLCFSCVSVHSSDMNLTWLSFQQNDVRVKFEFKGEKRWGFDQVHLFNVVSADLSLCFLDLWPLFFSLGSCSSLDPSSWKTWRRKPKWLSVRRWTFTTPTMRYEAFTHLHLFWCWYWEKCLTKWISTSKLCFLLAVGDSTDHSGRPGQGCGAAGSQRSHEEPEDPPGAPDLLSGEQPPDSNTRTKPWN